jgi:aspartyl-tRNA(Asn)/glutamyl-tRNA(Gln) amidotransferase subunit A
LRVVRNTIVANYLDRCAITIPCHKPGEAPVGLMLMGEHMADAALLRAALAVEAAIAA